MRGRLVIDCNEYVKKTKYYFEEGFSSFDDYDYLIGLDLPKNSKFDFTKFKQNFYRYLIKKLESKKYNSDFPDRVKLIKEIVNQNIDLLDNVFEVHACNLSEELFEKICEYYKNDSISIIINRETYPMTGEGYEQACNKYHNNPNVLVKVDGNKDEVSLEAYGKTVDKIEEIAKKIKKYNFSPLEEIIYAFDYAKNRYYKSEDENESLGKSRDLTSVLFGDIVVCEGYAAIFAAILQRLGYQASKYYVRSYKNNGGHAINIVRIKDDKYKLDGIYYFDPTWDSKNENLFGLSGYSHCGNYWPEDMYEDVTFGKVIFNSSWWDNSDEELLKKIKNQESLRVDEENRIREFYSMYEFVNGSCHLRGNNERISSESFDRFKSEIDSEYLKKLTNDLDLKFGVIKNNVLFQAIYNVRKIEYYENPEEFPLSTEDLHMILHLLEQVDREPYELEDDVRRFIDSKAKEIGGIRLAKVLSNISQGK